MINIMKKNIFVSLLMMIFIPVIPLISISSELDLLDEKAWYYKWQYWFIASICLILPVLAMLIVFIVELLVKVAEKLKVPGSYVYTSPYFWILGLIIPIVGWIIIIVTYIYLIFSIIFALKKD